MKIIKIFFLISLLFIFLALGGCSLSFLTKKKQGALEITTTPKATIFLNEEHLGQSPYFNENLKPGEYTLKIIPETADPPLASWQGMVKLSPGILTVVNRSLGPDEDSSSGYVLGLEPLPEKEKIRLSIISTPDSAVINLDGEPKGFAPLSLDNVSEGEHLLTLTAPGFQEEQVKAKTLKGYKLTCNVQLAKEQVKESPQPSPSPKTSPQTKASPSPTPKPSGKISNDKEASPSAEEMERPYVKIKDNTWGYLNLRSEPDISGGTETVITKIYPGEVYKFIEQNSDGWYKIEYEAGKEGWIAGKYATLYPKL